MTRALPHYRDYRRFAAPGQAALQVQPKTLPAPLRGLILNENDAFMQPGAALYLDNWFPTDKAIKIRGGSATWTKLGTPGSPGVADPLPVLTMFNYVASTNKKLFAANNSKIYDVTAAADYAAVITPMAGTPAFAFTNGNWSTVTMANAANQTYLIAVNDAGDPVLRFDGANWVWLKSSGIANWANSTHYVPGDYAKDTVDSTFWRCIFDHTSAATGGFAADRAANPNRWVSTAGDSVSWITYPGPVPPKGTATGLTQVWKYRGRLFFIQGGTMNAWYLKTIDAVGGELGQISLSGAFTKGGALMFGFSWSSSAGDGLDDKCCFITDQGEVAIFTGSNPGDPLNWQQQGRYQIARPQGKNAWARIGGDVLIITQDGIVPISQCISKDVRTLEFSAITRTIHPMWEIEMQDRNDKQWSMRKWDEFGGLFVTLPGGSTGSYRCLVANTVTGAWARFTGWDAMCFETLSGNMFFGTQNGRVVQADVGGWDEGSTLEPNTNPTMYTASYVGGWETFGTPQAEWHSLKLARVAYRTRAPEPFIPQVTAAVNYNYVLPPAPAPGPFTDTSETWDEGLWGSDGAVVPPDPPPVPTPEPGAARWDTVAPMPANQQSTGWLAIGEMGISHAPIVQISINQPTKPDVEMLGMSLLAEQCGIIV
jgi:hypothetical protein